MKRTETFDFGAETVVEHRGALYIKVLPGDDLVCTSYFVVEQFGEFVRIMEVSSEHEETYSNNTAVVIPKRVWVLALDWLSR